MTTTYTVTYDFAANTTAVADRVDQNFTDVLTALNSFDATNLTGTIALARISNLTSSQMSSAFFKDEDDMTSDSATAVSSQQAIKAYIATQIAASSFALSEYTNKDSNGDTMLKAHAYKAATGGQVTAYSDVTFGGGSEIKGYVGTTNDPAGAGDLIQREENDGVSYGNQKSVSFLVAEDEYFEIVTAGTATIRWKSFGTLSKPADQD